MLRMVTFDAPSRVCVLAITSSTEVPCRVSRSSSQPRSGVCSGSKPRSRLAIWPAMMSGSGSVSIGATTRCITENADLA